MLWLQMCIFWGCVKVKESNSLMKKDREEGIFWQTYSEELLRNQTDVAYVVYVTADWCVTCAIFEQQVLQEENVQQLFMDHNIMALRADGTQDDQEIDRLKYRYHVNMLPIVIYVPDPKTPIADHHVFSGNISKADMIQLFAIP